MPEEHLTLDFSRPIRLFPLQSCVLLPYATVPLHVFEPRYRAMLRDALDSDGLIAMAVFQGQKWKLNYDGNPPLRPCVAVGYLVRHDRLPDGRYNILLQGLCRARIIEEMPTHGDGYRLARMEPFAVDTPEDAEGDLDRSRADLLTLLEDPHLKGLQGVAAVQQWATDELPTTALIDLATLTLTQDTDERYAVLSEPNPRQRADWLRVHLESMRDLVVQAEQTSGGDPGADADGWPLN